MSTQDLIAANQAFYQAFSAMDVEAMGIIWSKGTNCICIHPGRPALRGWDQIRQSWEQIFRNTNQMQVQTEIIASEVVDTLGYVVLIQKLLQTVGNRPMEAEAIATNIFERMGSHWYLVHHHGSPVMQPMSPGPAPSQPFQ